MKCRILLRLSFLEGWQYLFVQFFIHLSVQELLPPVETRGIIEMKYSEPVTETKNM